MNDSLSEFTLQSLSEVDKAWVAGILEGEGCFTYHIKRYRSTTYGYPRVKCNMTDEDIILRLQTITGMGNVTSVVVPEGNKPMYLWMVSNTPDAVELMTFIRPLMGMRRGLRIDELLSRTRGRLDVSKT